MINLFMTKRDVGVYQVAYQANLMLVSLAVLFNVVLCPLFVTLLAQQRIDLCRVEIRRAHP